MRRGVRSSHLGPFPIWFLLSPAPMGYKWITLTSIDHSFLTDGGAKIAFPMVYAKKLPRVSQTTYWQLRSETQAMIDEGTNNQKPGKWVPGKDEFLKPYPHINQYCTDFWFEGQKPRPRIPCKLAFTFFGESVQLSLNDEEKRRSCHTTAETVKDAMELLEERLNAGSAPWRNWGTKR